MIRLAVDSSTAIYDEEFPCRKCPLKWLVSPNRVACERKRISNDRVSVSGLLIVSIA